jgi:predicted ester cyclase
MAAASRTDVSGAELVRRVFELINSHDIAGLTEHIWTQEMVERFPDRTCHGPHELGRYFAELFAAAPDLRMEPLVIAEQGEDVFVQWRLTGTHDGALMGIEPTHKRIVVDGIDHFVVRDGKVVSNFVVFDQMQWARQIGLLPPDGSGADKALKGAYNARTKLLARLGR